ncbi:MAG TPA: YoaK family protein [Baekduia sp.]
MTDPGVAVRPRPDEVAAVGDGDHPSGGVSLARRHALVVVLAVVSGATDAVGFLGLGGAFTSVMTGNMVLLGLGAGTGDGRLVAHAGLAIAAFVAGCVVGARVAGTPQPGDGVWPPTVTRALLAQLGVFALFAIGWEAAGAHPGSSVQLPLLAVNAIALGMQSSTTQRFGVAGLSTTYLTGTLTGVAIRLASGGGLRQAAGSLQILVGLVAGAALGGALTRWAPGCAPLVQLVGVGGVIAVVLRTPPRSSGRR